MGSVCVDTTQQVTTVRNVHRYTMISPGSRETEKQGHQMNAKVSGRGFTDPGIQDEHSPCQAKFPDEGFCPFTLMCYFRNGALMENLILYVVSLQLTHLSYWEVELTRQKSVLHAATSAHMF